ncbi:hypothetical protein [Desulfosarcina ovata]|uniref:Glycosyl transferase family 1 domain-containing protein n=1 Tax=Desulfosarcina ovata subsp. ovata TaxID=2752305 RepID=A0A5K8A784_9BACT|nr:hypothetical protein [Desulfosarcina ovata]BBO88331.1 hypothetical protein DSCOOX_15110 [Desulfosarcina ovata subsp. ovata]
MKTVWNDTGNLETGSTRIHIYNLQHWFSELGFDAVLNDWDHYENYDVLILGKNVPAREMERARKLNPMLLCGCVNPSDYTPEKREKSDSADFFIVGSIPEKDYYSGYQKPVFLFPQIERLFTRKKRHDDHSPIVLGYHGNKEHLEHFPGSLKRALEKLSMRLPIVLRTVYDRRGLDQWKIGRPDIEIDEVQWDLGTIETTLLGCDIGLVPGLTPISRTERLFFFKLLKWKNRFKKGYWSDYLIRFKNTTNAGRAFVFHQLGIPVVSDMIPTSFHILGDPDCGYLANSEAGWLYSLQELCSSSQRRAEISENALSRFRKLYDPLEWSRRLHREIHGIWRQRTGRVDAGLS